MRNNYQVHSGGPNMVNSTVVKLRDGRVLVVDTCITEPEAEAVLQQAQAAGEILLVFNTHEHGDHTAGNHLFAAPIVSSTAAYEVMRAEGGDKPGLPNCHFSQRLTLQIGGEDILLQHVGGHCPGNAIMYFPQRQLLFTGDLVFNQTAPWMGQADFARWIAILAELATWDVKAVVPGHGPVGGPGILDTQRQMLESFVADVRRMSAAEKSLEEMVQATAAKYDIPDHWHDMLQLAIPRVETE